LSTIAGEAAMLLGETGRRNATETAVRPLFRRSRWSARAKQIEQS
jgi:hypothetical protein